MRIKAKFKDNIGDFINKYNKGNPIELYLFLSMGENRKNKNIQSNEYLEAFVKLVNKDRIFNTKEEKNNLRVAISKIKVVLSGEGLHEFYVGKEISREFDKNWKEKQIPILNKLAPEYEFDSSNDIINWAEFTKDSKYFSALREVQNVYNSDDALKKIIDEVIVPEHMFRYKIDPDNKEAAAQAVRNYLFVESAVFLTCGKIVCYPASDFLGVIRYILNKLDGKGEPPYETALYLGYILKGF